MKKNLAEQIEPVSAEEEAEIENIPGALPAKQELALQAVISYPTLKEAALAAGISEATLWRYLKESNFNRRLRETRRDAVNHAVIRLQRASSDAVTVLSDLMRKEDAPSAARISAAKSILDYTLRVAEMDRLNARIERLENYIRLRQEEDSLREVAVEGKGAARR